jgi:hypothetical protein
MVNNVGVSLNGYLAFLDFLRGFAVDAQFCGGANF